MSEQTYKPETILVLRDGEVEDQYYDAIYAEKRREALRTCGREAVNAMLHAPAAIAKGVGWLVTHELQSS